MVRRVRVAAAADEQTRGNVMRQFLSAVVLCWLTMQGGVARADAFAPLPEGYHLVYRVEGISHNGEKLSADSKWALREKDGALLIELFSDDQPAFRLLYRDGNSLSIQMNASDRVGFPTGLAQYEDGLTYAKVPVFPFLPFNFRAFKIYSDIEKVLDPHPAVDHAEIRAKIGNIRHSIFAFADLESGNKVPYFFPADFKWNQGRPTHMRAGFGDKVFADMTYSDWRPLGNAQVPGRIVGRNALTGKVNRTFTLLKAEIREDAIPPIESLIPAGQYLTVSLPKGAASIEFDPEAGSFETQVDAQLKIWERVDRQKAIEAQNRQHVRIPLLISGVLAGLAVFLVAVRNWPRRK